MTPGPIGAEGRDAVLEVRGLTVGFNGTPILDGVDLTAWRGEILGIVGASGTGKSVLLRAVLGLTPRRAGTIAMFGVPLDRADDAERLAINSRIGVLFQQGALFSSMTVGENVALPMKEHMRLPYALRTELARLKIELVGLPPDTARKYPAELSGGMVKRAGLARALALDPELLFLDEPTSGLDPIGAADFDKLIVTLRDTLKLTVVMVTHDLDSLRATCDRIACLGEGRILAEGTIETLTRHEHPWVRSYFQGDRARLRA